MFKKIKTTLAEHFIGNIKLLLGRANTLWHGFHKMLDTLLLDSGLYRHDYITQLLQIFQVRSHAENPVLSNPKGDL